jgi:hypothetical protein
VPAEKPGSSAQYYLFVRSGPNQGVPQLEAPMVQDWIDSWVSTKKGTFDFKKVTTSERNAIDGGLEKIRQVRAILSPALRRVTGTLWSHLCPGTGTKSASLCQTVAPHPPRFDS